MAEPRSRFVKKLLAITLMGLFTVIAAELVLRAYKSMTYDGILHLRSSSINNVPHPKYGWISPPSRSFHKSDPCYGTGTVSYNSRGFRAPPPERIPASSPLICILGDSTLQGYQLPDGTHLPHLLSARLKKDYPDHYILPLGVGGYGSLQELLLYQDYCAPFNPDLTVLLYSENDPQNNNFTAVRHSAANNVRPTPFLIDGRIKILRPYPFHVSEWLDNSLLVRLINLIYLNVEVWLQKDSRVNFRKAAIEKGWEVINFFAEELSKSPEPKILLVESTETRAISVFEKYGFKISKFEPITPEMTCLPRDSHPNSRGHALMLEALLPDVISLLESSSKK